MDLMDKDTKSYANSQHEEFEAEHVLGGEFRFRWPANPHPERGRLLRPIGGAGVHWPL